MKISRFIPMLLMAVFAVSCEQAENPGDGGHTDTTPSVVRVGIMGDSISTFEGELVNDDYKFHYPCVEGTRNNPCGVSKVEQTWWWQLINEKMENGVLDVNNSFSGTKVSHGTYPGLSGTVYEAGFVDRVGDFIDPDVIIIHGGANDCIKDDDKVNIGDYQWDTPLAQMDLTKFRSAYVYLVRKLQELYDGVQLILIVGDRLGADASLQYDDTIIEIAKHFDLPYVDLTPHRKTDIPVPDNVHPSAEGHAFIAQKVYDTCKDYLTAGPKPEIEQDMPAEFAVTLDFASWPFAEPCAEASAQTATKAAGGEYYSYLYKYTKTDGTEGQSEMKFGIKRSHAASGDVAYSYADGCLSFGTAADGATYGIINVPWVKDRYVSSIEITHDRKAYFTIADGTRFAYDATPNANTPDAAGPTLVEFPYENGGKSVPAGDRLSYNIRMRTSGVGITKIVVTYSATEPK